MTDNPNWDWAKGYCKLHLGQDLPCKKCVKDVISRIEGENLITTAKFSSLVETDFRSEEMISITYTLESLE